MSPQPDSPRASTAQEVGAAFAEHYYLILHESPELMYRFYQDSSVLSRHEPGGDMTSVTTTEAINDKILSLNCKDFKVEIRTVDAQNSHEGGVLVLVSGWITGRDNIRRKFVQTFFLAPQDTGYFVLNDIFRYVDSNAMAESHSESYLLSVDEVTGVNHEASFSHDQESAQARDHHTSKLASQSDGEISNGDEVGVAQEEENSAFPRKEAISVIPSVANDISMLCDTLSVGQMDFLAKQSYASAVKVMKERRPAAVTVATSGVKAIPLNSKRQSSALAALPSEAHSSYNIDPAIIGYLREAERRSVYVRNLPLNTINFHLEQEFKKFGRIKPGGVKVRSNKDSCFGFVEFESEASAQRAIKASPIMVRGKQAFVEEKRTTWLGGGMGGLGKVGFMPTGGGSSGSFRSQ